MAELGRVILNGQHQVTVNADPTSGGGIAAPLGSLAFFGATYYSKTGSLDTEWLLGASGGIAGPVGATGLLGPTGIIGDTGVQGIGETGLDGITGVQGIDGETGLVGETGAFGGPQGDTGVAGLGVTGFQGVTGIQGITGVGEDGDQGVTGVGVGIILDLAGLDHSQSAILDPLDALSLIDGTLFFVNLNSTVANTGMFPTHTHLITVTYNSVTGQFQYAIGGGNHAPPNDHVIRTTPLDGFTGVQGDTGIQGETGA